MEILEDLPMLSEEEEEKLESGRLPFGGLFGNSVLLRVLREIVADPHREFRPKELEALTASSAPRIKNALDALMSQGMLENISKDAQRPVYKVNLECKRLTALTLLIYAVTDDRDGTCCMDDAIRHYYDEDLLSGSKDHDSHEISISADGSKEIRITMSHTAAERLSEKLGRLLEDAHRRGELKIDTP